LPYQDTVQNRKHFEELVLSGDIGCKGFAGEATLERFVAKAMESEALPKDNLFLVAGIPSAQQPSTCLFILYFDQGYSYIIYQDADELEFVRLLMLE